MILNKLINFIVMIMTCFIFKSTSMVVYVFYDINNEIRAIQTIRYKRLSHANKFFKDIV
jgi:hypothetical protein